MKNFFKKISFVMAAAMVITSLHAPANAKAASSDYVTLKGKKVTKKSIFVGGQKVNFDYKIGKMKNKGAGGSWVSTNTSILTVDKKGIVTAVGTGTADILYKTKKKGKVSAKTLKVTVTAYARAEAVKVEPMTVDVKMGESAEAMAMLDVKQALKDMDVKSTYNVFAETADTEKIEVMAEKSGKITVKGLKVTGDKPATVMVYAAQKNSLDSAKTNAYVKKAEFKVNVMNTITAEQVGANKILVKGQDLSKDASKYEIKNENNLTLNIKKDGITVNEAKTEAVLEADYPKIFTGKYTLSYNKLDKVSFAIEEVKVAKITFTSEKKEAILAGESGTDLKKATVLYKVFDQFNNDITDTPIPDLNVVASTRNGAKFEKKGEILLDNTGGEDFRLNIDKVSVTVVDKKTGVTATDVFNISTPARISEIKIVGVYSAEKKQFVKMISQNEKDKKFNLVFDFMDQYGRTVLPKDGGENFSEKINVALLSATGLELKENTAFKFKHDNKTYSSYEIKFPEKLDTGKVIINVIGLYTGAKANEEFEVTHGTKVDKISVYAAKEVYAGQDNILEFEAYDLQGNRVTDIDVLDAVEVSPKTKVKNHNTETVFYFKKNEKGETKLHFDLTKFASDYTTETTPEFFSFITQTNKHYSATINVRQKRYPKEFIGFTDDVPAGVTKGNDFKVKLSQLKFVDQFGYSMTGKEAAALDNSEYKLKITLTGAAYSDPTNGAKTPSDFATGAEVALNGTEDTVVINSGAANVDEANNVTTVKVFFYKGAAPNVATDEPTKTYTIYSVPLDKMSNFGIEREKLVQPAADLYPNRTVNKFRPTVYGFYKGHKIQLGESDFVVYDGVDNGAKKSFYVNVPKKADMPAGKTTNTEKFEVIVQNKDVTRVTGEYSYSTGVPKVSKAVFDAEAKASVKKNDSTVSWSTLKVADSTGKIAFKLQDQYEESNDTAPFVTFKFDKADLDSKKVVVNSNGAQNATVSTESTEAGTVDGYIRLDFPGTGYFYEGPITITITQ